MKWIADQELYRIILGQIEPAEGAVKTGQLTRFNYVDQGRLQLNEENTVFDEVGDGTEFVIFGEDKLSLRSYLKRFLFTDERIATQVKYLSGGERSRRFDDVHEQRQQRDARPLVDGD